MAKRAKKRQPTQTPPEWPELFGQNDDELTHVRMLWRRGGGRYRPIVPVNLALEDLEGLEFEDWEDLELPETNFEWAVPVPEDAEARKRRLEQCARDLWAIAVMWARAKGPVCDFQLRGYGGGDDNILFEDGKRCNLSGEQSRYDDVDRERPTLDETVRSMISDERGAWVQMDRIKDGLINRLTEDREKLFKNLDRTTAAAPELIERARDVLERTITFQQEQFAEQMSWRTGQRQLEIEAFKEHARNKRAAAGIELLKDIGRAAFVAAPGFFQLYEEFSGNTTQAMPRFQSAQQAAAYLYLSVQPERLAECFTGTSTERIDRAKEVLAALDKLSRVRSEMMMLEQAEELIKNLLASPMFVEIATPTEAIVARYIIGRAAIIRVAMHDEESAA